jgi:hypothetical protein
MKLKMNKFWKSIMSSKDPTSSKRLVTLIMALHLILASFMILFIAFYVIFYTTKGRVDKDLLDMLKDVLEYDFWIVTSGLGFITADNLGQVMLERTKAKMGLLKQDTEDKSEEAPIEPEPPK